MPKPHPIDIVETRLAPGRFLLAATRKGLCRIAFPTESGASFTSWIGRTFPNAEIRERQQPFETVIKQLRAYFEGKRKQFDVPLDFYGSAFQKRVWAHLCGIPFGTTTSYGAIAQALSLPHAFRAVGAANGANPIPIIAPCHRVVGADGRLTGFGGGLPLKEQLLTLEGVRVEKGRVVAQRGQQSLFLGAPAALDSA